jgi:hypothetical protein
MNVRTVAIAAALALGTASLAAAEVKNIDRTLPLNAAGTLALDVHNGTIQIRTWDKPQVDVHVHIDWPGLSASSSRYPTVDISGSSDRVSVRWNNSQDPRNWTFWSLFDAPWGPYEVRYDITAPKSAHLEIHNHNASTDIRDFAGALDVSTHNGRTRVDFASFTQNTRIEMHNGMFDASMPASSKFNFDSHGHHAYVDSDFKPATHAVFHGRGDNHVGGTVNGGGADLRIVCHNGSIRLHSKG